MAFLGWNLRWLAFLGLILHFCLPVRGQTADRQLLELVRSADIALATTGFRLSTANASLCDRLEPGIGIQLHTIEQYAPVKRSGIRAHFRFTGPVAIEGIVPGSPADRAGLRQDDTVISVGDVRPEPAVSAEASTDQLAAFTSAIAVLPPAQPIDVMVARAGLLMTIRVVPVPACRTRYELVIQSRLDARANGELVQISSAYYDKLDDELVSAVVAHELAHNILRHRERLSAAGVDFGLASGFGRNLGYFRQAELEADTLSVHLLVRAGYPAALGERLWQQPVMQSLSGIFRGRSHPHWKDRLRIMRAERAKIAEAPKGSFPTAPFVAQRKLPLHGVWKPLVPRD